MTNAARPAMITAPLSPLLRNPSTIRKRQAPAAIAVETLIFGLPVGGAEGGGVFEAGGSDALFKWFPQDCDGDRSIQ
ncbi:hypothetical protein GCM10009582_10340 [Arthrobacter flavus]